MFLNRSVSTLILFLALMYHATGETDSIVILDTDKDLNSSIEIHTADPPTYDTAENTFFNLDEITKWNILLSHSLDIVRFMMCQTNITTCVKGRNTVSNKHKKRKSYLLLYTTELAKITPEFEKALSCSETAPEVIAWEMDVFSDKDQLLEILLKSLAMEKDVRSVIVASSHVDFIHLIFDIVTSDAQFKWRLLFHATEWLVLTTHQIPQNSLLLNHKNLPDFMTVASAQEFYFEINQKSRTQPMNKVFEIARDMDSFKPTCHTTTETNSSRFFNCTHKTFQPSETHQYVNQFLLSQRLRRDAMTFLSSKKSVMADMHIPTVIVMSKQERMAFVETRANKTYWTGFNIDILNLLSEFLGFISEPFPVSDGGYYSVFKSNGDILGITGYLYRREAGLSPMDMVSSKERRDVIDFIFTNTRELPFYIMYKINQGKSQLGDPRSELIDTKQDLIFVLIGPCIVMVVGLFVFLVSGVFLNAGKIYGRENFRRLYDFPFQCMFQTTEHNPHQSGRILRASWGLFCVAMFASYGALLTTNATAPPEYPKLTNVWDLLKHPNFKIGVCASNSHFMTSMEQAKKGEDLWTLWRVLTEQNKSDPGTFSTDKAYHTRRVLEGDYAFLDNTPLGLFTTLVDADYSDVRFAKLYKREPKIAVPEDAFYGRNLQLALMTATELGLLQAISDKWFPPKNSLKRSKVKYDPVVKLFRLRFLFYIAVIGIGLASVSLVVERLLRLHSYVMKSSM